MFPLDITVFTALALNSILIFELFLFSALSLIFCLVVKHNWFSHEPAIVVESAPYSSVFKYKSQCKPRGFNDSD